jgi:hypothetical protein
MAPDAMKALSILPLLVLSLPTLALAAEPDPPTFTGTIVRTADHVALQTPNGTFDLATAGTGWADKFAAETVAFEGQTVTIKGWPDVGNSHLVVQEFSPGASADFVNGRVETTDAGTGIRVRADKWVKIADPTLAARLAPFGNGSGHAGVILPGTVTRTGDTWTFNGTPDKYWLLTRLNTPEAFGDKMRYPADTPFEKVQMVGPAFPGIPAADRIFAFGHVPDAAETIDAGPAANLRRRFVVDSVSKPVPSDLEYAINGRRDTGINVSRDANTVPAAAPAAGAAAGAVAGGGVAR